MDRSCSWHCRDISAASADHAIFNIGRVEFRESLAQAARLALGSFTIWPADQKLARARRDPNLREAFGSWHARVVGRLDSDVCKYNCRETWRELFYCGGRNLHFD